MVRSYRSVVLVCIGSIVTVAAYYNSNRLYELIRDDFAWDFAINWIAAHGMISGLSVYNIDALRVLGESLIGPQMPNIFISTFTSYIGPPSTVFIYFAFIPFSFSRALFLYRLTVTLVCIIAIIIAGWAIPSASRKRGWAIGAILFSTVSSVTVSIWLGQVDAFVMLALAVGVWATSKERLYLAGVCIGIAALLKISPALLVFYFLLRGKWKILVGALAVCATLVLCTAFIGAASDVSYFTQNIVPLLSFGSVYAQNQSLPAFLGRMLLPAPEYIDFSTHLGSLRLLSPLISFGGVVIVWWLRRHQPFYALEGGLVIIAGLLAGPITWDHYASWAIIACVFVADARLWVNVDGVRVWILSGLLLLGWMLQIPAIPYEIPRTAALHLRTGAVTLSLLVWFAAMVWLLTTVRARSPLTLNSDEQL